MLVPYRVLVVGCNVTLYVSLLAPVHTLAGASHHAPSAAFLTEERVTGNTLLGAECWAGNKIAHYRTAMIHLIEGL